MPSRGGIDYSKWDHFPDSDDDEKEEDSHVAVGQSTEACGGVRVTRLEAPSSVTFGGTEDAAAKVSSSERKAHTISPNSTNKSSNAPSSAPPPPPPPQKEQETQNALASSNTLANTIPNQANETVGPPPKWIEKGGSCWLPKNGSTQLHWSQDRYSVTLRFAIDQQDRKHWVARLTGHVSTFQNRHVAVSADRARLQISQSPPLSSPAAVASAADPTSVVLVDDEIPYPVHWEEEDAPPQHDEDGTKFQGGSLDWWIERDERPSSSSSSSLTQQQQQEEAETQVYLTITLQKASPMAGLVLWWKRPLQQCPEIILEHVSEESSAKSSQFQQAWNEAHEQFRTKMANRQQSSST